VAAGHSQQETLNEVLVLGKKILPEGYHLKLSGSSDDFKKSLVDLLVAFVLGIFVAYMVLGSQFNSFIDPVTVLIALPFSVTGALMALWAGHQSLNIYSGIGIILVAGIVKKNSIMLVEFTNEVREAAGKGKDVTEALLEACPVRLRPILMTSVAIVVGALPPALALGPGAETRVPMADTVIGGVLVAMVLTLFVVPCVYLLFSRLGGDHVNIDVEKLLAEDPHGGIISGVGHAPAAAAPVKGAKRVPAALSARPPAKARKA
jgi:multidrug efflux pump subunit AcrB